MFPRPDRSGEYPTDDAIAEAFPLPSPRSAHALPVLALVLLAGCAAPGALDAASLASHPDALAVMNAAGQRIVAHDSRGPVPVPEAWRELEVRFQRTGLEALEPTIGVLRDGSMVMPALRVRPLALDLQMNAVYPYLSQDGGRTWEPMAAPATMEPAVSNDPWVAVDAATDRLYVVGTTLACVSIAWTDDVGTTWSENHAACGAAASTYSDHESLSVGPPPAGEEPDHESLVYVARNGGPGYAVKSLEGSDLDSPVFGSYAAVSRDGGATFEPAVRAHLQDGGCNFGIQGPIHVGVDGIAYYPKATCRGLDVAVTRDGGRTWTLDGRIEDQGAAKALQNPHVATDAAGTAYAAWQGQDGLVWLARGRDAGSSWDAGVRVSPPELTSTFFTQVVGGDAGRIAVLYHATRADTSRWAYPEPDWAPEDAAWDTFLTFSEDADAEDPIFITIQVNTDGPIHRGCTALGFVCPNRAHYDFVGLTQLEGRAIGAIMDACGGCATASESTKREGVVLVVEKGPLLTSA